MNSKAILDEVVQAIREIPVNLYGDDSPLADPWEEIKDQVQHEKSVFWPAYLDTMNSFVDSTIASLSPEDRTALAAELNTASDNQRRLSQTIMNRLLARARREKIRYEPFDFTFFWYLLGDMTVYGQVLERTGLFTCEILAYSAAAPSGERGEVNTDIIEDTMSAEEFALARQRRWPDKWDSQHTTLAREADWDICDEVATAAGISFDEAQRAAEALLKGLHRRLVEYRGLNGDYLGEMAHHEFSERAFYHLMGFVEQFSINYSWEEGTISEYLGRLPPVERWKALAQEISEWDWRDA